MKRSLKEFTKNSWPIIEPSRDFYDNWHIDAISEHLQAVVHSDIKRLIINVPPRHEVNICCCGSAKHGHGQLIQQENFCLHHMSLTLSIRDSVKCRRLIDSPWYKQHFGNIYGLTTDQNQKQRFENDKTGIRIATSVDGALTGEGGDIIVIDDPHNVREAESNTVRQGVLEWWDQSMQTRLNDPKNGAFVIIMQRVHENDLTGHILANEYEDWDHLCLPARYEHDHPTPLKSTLAFEDPRQEDGELLWPDRIDERTLNTLEQSLGSYASAWSKLQQRPMPKGGGILKAEWWQPWEEQNLPNIEYVLASPMTQLFLQKRKHHILPEPLGEFLDLWSSQCYCS